MRLLDIVTAPWAILPVKFGEVLSVYEVHLRGEKIKLEGPLAALAKDPSADRQPYEVVDGVAILPVEGILTKRASWLASLCGMTGMEMVGQDLQAALDDPNVTSIILAIDSPGGTVDGTQTLADQVFAARAQKPIAAWIDGCGCSAAYWIASATAQIFISGDCTYVGSIGVVQSHTDVSGSEAARGRKTTEITAGKYKRIASSYAPLSEEGKATIQAEVDHVYSVFVETVARNRGLSVDSVLADAADGRVFLGQQGIEAGLVDGVSTLAGLVDLLNQGAAGQASGAGAASATATAHSQEASMPITLEQLKAEAPELLATIQAEATAQATATETARVKGCLDAALPGHEALALQFALDGKTTPGDAALAINAAERKVTADAAAEVATAGSAPVKTAGDPGKGDEKKAITDPKAYAAQITAHITAEAAKGRTLTTEQAAYELAGKE